MNSAATCRFSTDNMERLYEIIKDAKLPAVVQIATNSGICSYSKSKPNVTAGQHLHAIRTHARPRTHGRNPLFAIPRESIVALKASSRPREGFIAAARPRQTTWRLIIMYNLIIVRASV